MVDLNAPSGVVILPLKEWSIVAKFARKHLGAHGGERPEGEYIQIPRDDLGDLIVFYHNE